ncbi:hypothetical protein RJ640_012728 [Escallonia rubra]|uniref:Uncharacterized protein n=1 Tax=Escallonia rubra TaxID=112253 RepID=A0AA88RM30_9ASTE|nr:hypothetical protein RJ640_012728 [Escallonia rubra]
MPRRIGLFNRLRSNTTVPRENIAQYPKWRGYDWLDIELGEYVCKGGEDGELEMSVMEVEGGNWKGGLIVEGIEIRPKDALFRMGIHYVFPAQCVFHQLVPYGAMVYLLGHTCR